MTAQHSTALGLIHNNNESRNTYIRPSLEKLLEECPRIFTTKIEVSFQPEIKPHGTFMAFLRDVMYTKLFFEWHKYRLLNPTLLPLYVLGFCKNFVIKYLINCNGTGTKWKKSSAIEVTVTDKHIRAWASFLETEGEFLICFEDDAVFMEDSVQRIINLIDMLSSKNKKRPIYIDLAGGCTLDELKIDNLEVNRDNNFRYYTKPVTNTACVYLMNRSLVVHFYDILARKPWLRLIGVDWMMNKLFMIMTGMGLECICIHASPTIFRHGSTTGEYAPWIR